MKIKFITKEIKEEFLKNLSEGNVFSDKITDYLKIPKQTIQFTEEAWDKVWALIDCCEKEIGWHGLVKRLDDNNYQIYDILVYPQTVTGVTITCDEEKFGKWMADFMMDEKFPYNDLRMHGHSHVNMQCSPSGTDTQLQNDLTKHLKENDFYMFFIMNKKRDYWATIYDYKRGIVFETNDIVLNPNSQIDWADDQIQEFVKEQEITTSWPATSPINPSYNLINTNTGHKKTSAQIIIDNYLDKLGGDY